MRRSLLCLVGILVAIVSLPASAQACAGFTDVTVFSSFCTNVQWLKNRGITLGCTPTTYCPDEAVNRLQMAAFMNRVGNVLTPLVLSVETTGATPDLENPSFVCQTADIADVNYSRDVHADAGFSFTSSGPGLLQLSVFASFDGGATWQPAPINDAVVTVQMSGGGRDHANLTLQRRQYPFGGTGTTRFGIRLVRGTNLSNASLSSWTCHFQVVVSTRAE